jgi:molybdenum cofactor cytidylyltransferase
MGSPKALLPFGGRTALAWLLDAIAKAGVAHAVVVAGDEPAVAAAARSHGAAVAVNPAPDRGRTSSLQCGLAEVPSDRWVLVAPVDCPLVAPSTLRAILERAEARPLVRPRYLGRGGHPLLVSPTLRLEVQRLAPEAPLRTVVRRDPLRVTEVDVDDPEVVANLDTPSDHKAALARFARGRGAELGAPDRAS